jgi:hypothetical protein
MLMAVQMADREELAVSAIIEDIERLLTELLEAIRRR